MDTGEPIPGATPLEVIKPPVVATPPEKVQPVSPLVEQYQSKAQELKIPYMIIVGKKEVEAKQVSIRLRDGQNINGINLEEFIAKAKEIFDTKSLNLW